MWNTEIQYFTYVVSYDPLKNPNRYECHHFALRKQTLRESLAQGHPGRMKLSSLTRITWFPSPCVHNFTTCWSIGMSIRRLGVWGQVKFLLFFCHPWVSNVFPGCMTFERPVDNYILYGGQMKVREKQGRWGKDIKYASILISKGEINPYQWLKQSPSHLFLSHTDGSRFLFHRKRAWWWGWGGGCSAVNLGLSDPPQSPEVPVGQSLFLHWKAPWDRVEIVGLLLWSLNGSLRPEIL